MVSEVSYKIVVGGALILQWVSRECFSEDDNEFGTCFVHMVYCNIYSAAHHKILSRKVTSVR